MFTMPRGVACALCAAALAALIPLQASAQTVFVDGTVVDDSGRPVAGAAVRIAGQNITLITTTSARGDFAFSTLTVGTYELTVSKNDLRASQSIDVSSNGLSLKVTLTKLATIGRVVVATGAPVARRSGTDVSVDAAQLAHLPTGGSLPSILAQLPSAAMGSNGQVHVNGDHNGLNYYIDGVQVPSNLNRVLGTEVDPADIGYSTFWRARIPRSTAISSRPCSTSERKPTPARPGTNSLRRVARSARIKGRCRFTRRSARAEAPSRSRRSSAATIGGWTRR